MSFRNLDIIYFTLFPWDNAYSSVSLSFTREFVKNNRVFYVNHPYTWKDFWAGRNEKMVKERSSDLWRGKMRYESIPELPENVIGVHPPNTIPVNFLPEGKLYESFFEWNNRLILRTIKQIVKDYDLKGYIYFNCFNPYYAPYLPRPEFQPALNIYQCIDDMTGEEYTAKHGARLEEEAIAGSDVSVVTSHQLWELKKHLNPNVYKLHNAVDKSIFDIALKKELARPEEIKDVKTKIIGFTGNINEYRLNYPLIKAVAEGHPDKTLVMVGPLNSDDYKEHGLDEMSNVIFTGGKHISELPSYLQHFDCTIIPFYCNKLTSSVYPLKINEYLSAGKAVISTNFSVDIRGFEKDIYIAEDEVEFVKLIDKAIAENSQERIDARSATAETNTWTARVGEFWDIVGKHIDQEKFANQEKKEPSVIE
ncbi:MAG: teichuronic acid biosynthesis glycosyltransferase TuaH [Saprospiraceae bacterium]|jgi:teichuronic acid biosynthesis glycosyltransferase TuaH